MSVPDDELLRRIPFFRRLSPELRSRVAEVARIKRHDRGDLIFAEGDPSDAFMTVVSGPVKVFKSTPAGKEIILEIFGAGDPLGAVAVYEGAPFMASALALEPSDILRIEQHAFFRLLEDNPAFVRGLLSGLTIRLAELTPRLAEMSGARVEARFALGNADELEQALRLGACFVGIEPAVELEAFADLVSDRKNRVQARHRLLKNHRDLVAAQAPQTLFGRPVQVLPL